MFKSVFPSKSTVTLFFEGEPLQVPEGLSVAAAVLQSHKPACRITGKSGAERSSYCCMGICYECLMEIDGVPNQQACMIQVCEGMRIHRQNGDPDYTALEKRQG